MTDAVLRKQDWRKLLKGGFDFQTAPFAIHPLDAKRARKMVFAAMREKASIDEIKDAARVYLKSKMTNDAAIEEQVKAVERFVRSIKPVRRKKSAWLIMWGQASSAEPAFEDRIITIRDGRTSSEKIKEFVRDYYIATVYSLDEKMTYSSYSRQRDNPYPAEYVRGADGVRREGLITCGHNPRVCARFVCNLRFFENEDGGNVLTWEDP